MTNQEREKQKSKKRVILKIFFLTVNILIILFLYFLLTEFGANPYIILLILLFVFLTFAGPLLRSKGKSFYSKMYPDKKEILKERAQRRREEYEKRDEMKRIKLRQLNRINLDFKYSEPIIRNCDNCGMIMAKFVKKCPVCGKEVKSHK